MASSHLVLILLKVASVLKEDRQMATFINHAYKMILEITSHYLALVTVAYILTGMFIMMSLQGLKPVPTLRMLMIISELRH
jgi:choline-glycine betaine transporter